MRAYPEISAAYELYTLCRSQTLITHDVTRGGKQMTRTEPFTTGLAQMPEEGGMLDQPHRLMDFFSEFISGERRSFGT